MDFSLTPPPNTFLLFVEMQSINLNFTTTEVHNVLYKSANNVRDYSSLKLALSHIRYYDNVIYWRK